MFVYPKAGIRVRDPVRKDLLPEKGREVADNDIYWLRRIADGDVVIKQPAAPAPANSGNGITTSRSADA